MALLEKQKRFCEEYVKDFNGSAAARRSGYSVKTSKEAAAQLLNKSTVQEYLAGLISDIQKRHELEVDSLIVELKRIAFSDLANYYGEDNSILPVNEIDKEARSAIEQYADFKTDTKYGKKEVRKIKLNSKLDAIEKLMRYMGAYERDNKQKNDIYNRSTDDLVAELAAIRARRNQNDEEE